MAKANYVEPEELRKRLQFQMGIKPKEEEETGAVVGLEDGEVYVKNSTLEKLGEKLIEITKDTIGPELTKAVVEVGERVEKRSEEKIDGLTKVIQESLNSSLEELTLLANKARPIEITFDGKKTEVKGIVHREFDKLLKTVASGLSVLMVGPAGTGKSHSAETIANALGLNFYAISVGQQTSKSDLIGYMSANGNYVRTQFREAYENGGVFLLDEMDAGNSNVLILLNSALSNGQMAFPDKMVKRHPDFRMIGTANTYGYGASRQYVGRNQIDAATLDRFVTIDWDIDEQVERSLAVGSEGERWYQVVKAVRDRAVGEMNLRVVISPRATQRGSIMLAAGIPFHQVLDSALLAAVPVNEKKNLMNLAQTVWNK